MKTISKALVGTVAAGAMAMASATPAMAQDRHHRDNDGISAGEIIAGALIIGGIVAVATSGRDNDRYRDDYRYRDDRRYRDGYRYDDRRYDDRRYDDRRYDDRRGHYQDPRSAVEQCVRTAERTANRYSYGGRSKVTDIRKVDRVRGGYEIKGRIAVNSQGRDWRRGDRYYGNGWDNDYRGYNDNYRGYDSGKFTCLVRNGRVVDVDFRGIRGLR